MATDVQRRPTVEQFAKYVPTRWLLSVLSVFAGLLVWQGIGTGVISLPISFAPPTEVAKEWVDLVVAGDLQTALYHSLHHMLAGYVIAALTAIPLAFLMARSKIVEWAVNPFIDMLYATPAIAYIPLIIIWFGLHFEARVFMVFTMSFFEMLINTHEGISSISEEFTDVAKSFDASWAELQRKVLLPASTPHIFAGLRLGAGRAVRAMIVAELFLAIVNLGEMLEAAGRTYETDVMLAIIVTITAVGVVFQQLVVYAEQKAIPWHFTGEEGH